MLSTALLNALAFLPQGGVGTSSAPVVINEFNYDDTSTDTLEFVELYNRSGAPVDISGWTLIGDDSNGINFTQVIPAGTVLAAGDYYVIGDAIVPNVDLVLASGFLQNDAESITLYDAGAVLIDTLIYEANKGVFNPALAEGEGIWGNYTLTESLPTTWSRLRDGFDTDNNGNDFRLLPWSPGTSNNSPVVSQMVEPFDGLALAGDVPGWGGSFVVPRVIDPTLVDGNNLNAIPASPQGGLAGIAWDPSGGGNHTMMLADPSLDVRAEAYVYFEATPLPASELEMWSFGLGTSGTFFNFPDPAGTLGFTANGDTGLVWTYVRDDAGATLYLIDRNDGGLGANALTPPVVVGSIPIVAGQNDGWQRLLLIASNTVGVGRFGGNYGANDGTLFTTTIAAVDRGLYVSYREGVATNAIARPFTFDLLSFDALGGAQAVAFGTGCDNLTLGANGLPVIGNAAFALDVGGITLGPIGFVGFGSAAVNPGIDLTAIGMPGCSAYTNLDIALASTGPVVGGVGTYSLPIPATPSLAGSVLATQGVALSLATPLNLVSSNGVTLVVGF